MEFQSYMSDRSTVIFTFARSLRTLTLTGPLPLLSVIPAMGMPEEAIPVKDGIV